MAEFNWKEETLLNKLVYCVGWLAVLNIVFWIAIIVVGNLNMGDKFWDGKTHFVVYVFGWIYLVSLVFLIVVLFLL